MPSIELHPNTSNEAIRLRRQKPRTGPGMVSPITAAITTVITIAAMITTTQ